MYCITIVDLAVHSRVKVEMQFLVESSSPTARRFLNTDPFGAAIFHACRHPRGEPVYQILFFICKQNAFSCVLMRIISSVAQW